VIIAQEFSDNVVQVLFADHHEMVQALPWGQNTQPNRKSLSGGGVTLVCESEFRPTQGPHDRSALSAPRIGAETRRDDHLYIR
jgi:hypothetical protein